MSEVNVCFPMTLCWELGECEILFFKCGIQNTFIKNMIGKAFEETKNIIP